jgi:hypothetical protein
MDKITAWSNWRKVFPNSSDTEMAFYSGYEVALKHASESGHCSSAPIEHTTTPLPTAPGKCKCGEMQSYWWKYCPWCGGLINRSSTPARPNAG